MTKRIAIPTMVCAECMMRSHGLCECGCGRPLMPNFEYHHVVPVEYGGSNTADNIKVVNKECHKRLTRSFIKAHSKIKRIEKEVAALAGDVLGRIEERIKRTPKLHFKDRLLLQDCQEEIARLREKETA